MLIASGRLNVAGVVARCSAISLCSAINLCTVLGSSLHRLMGKQVRPAAIRDRLRCKGDLSTIPTALAWLVAASPITLCIAIGLCICQAWELLRPGLGVVEADA